MTDLGGVEEAARRRERRLRGVLDALPYLVAQISSDGAVTYVNPTGAAMVDRRSEQIVGRPLTALGYPPPLAATWAAAIGRVTATGTPVPVDYEVVGAGGTRRMEGGSSCPSGTRLSDDSQVDDKGVIQRRSR